MYKSEPFFDFRYQKGLEFCANFDFIDQLKSRKVGVYDSIAVFQKLFAFDLFSIYSSDLKAKQ
jgi:hypothetical protein